MLTQKKKNKKKKKTVNLVVVCGMVMHSMVIILTIKTRQKKNIFFSLGTVLLFWFPPSFLVQLFLPFLFLANGVAKLARLLAQLFTTRAIYCSKFDKIERKKNKQTRNLFPSIAGIHVHESMIASLK